MPLQPTTGMLQRKVLSCITAAGSGRSIVGYLQLQPGISPAALEEPFRQLLKKHTPAAIQANLHPYVEPLGTYYRTANNGVVNKLLFTLSGITAFILLMAVVNFVNITVSRSTSRLKEIGLRKALGSQPSQLVAQFLTESLLVALLATGLAILLYQFLRPLFSRILQHEVPAIGVFPGLFLAGALSLGIITGLLGGVYPSLLVASLDAIDSIKGKMKRVGEKARLRKVLLGFQFGIATMVLVGTVIIAKQVNFFFSKRLGYNKDWVLAAQLPREWSAKGVDRMETVRDEFARMPVVSEAALSWEIPNGMGFGNMLVYRQGEVDSKGITAQALVADERYAQTYQIPLLAGQFFSRDGKASDTTKVVINQTAATALGYQSAQDAVGQQLILQGQPASAFSISGVTKDFQFASRHQKVQPMVWANIKLVKRYRYLTLRLRPGDVHSSVVALQHQWSRLVPEAPFGYRFLDETLQKLYQTELQLQQASYLATGLSVAIVLLGLVGLVSLSVQKRSKEMGIRKVLGASVIQMIRLFLREFLLAFLLAGLIACPIVYCLMEEWLRAYSTRITITAGPFLLSLIILTLMSSLLIILQTLKAALANPVDALRNE